MNAQQDAHCFVDAYGLRWRITAAKDQTLFVRCTCCDVPHTLHVSVIKAMVVCGRGS